MSRLVFGYGDEEFICGAIEESPGRFRAQLVRQRPWPEAELLLGGQGSRLFQSEWAALQWAEQMAVRWVQQQRAERAGVGLRSGIQRKPSH
ncbi:MAG: hypothetical protein EON54_17805 [Alcaligenaceae bacterium]|nr:MAG: hypothetical protein EON54_17805 [Alcaligenaceae bacterium]